MQERFGEALGLLPRDLRRHRRFVRVHHDVDQRRARVGERCADGGLQIGWVFHPHAEAAVGVGPGSEVGGALEAHPVLGVTQSHLLPQDLTEHPVVAHHHLDRQPVTHGGEQLGHEHGKTAVTDEGDALAVGVRQLGGQAVGQARGHGRQVPRQIELTLAPDVEVARRPSGDGAGIRAQDGVIGGEPVDDPHQVLRLDRVTVGALQSGQVLSPPDHRLLCVLVLRTATSMTRRRVRASRAFLRAAALRIRRTGDGILRCDLLRFALHVRGLRYLPMPAIWVAGSPPIWLFLCLRHPAYFSDRFLNVLPGTQTRYLWLDRRPSPREDTGDQHQDHANGEETDDQASQHQALVGAPFVHVRHQPFAGALEIASTRDAMSSAEQFRAMSACDSMPTRS